MVGGTMAPHTHTRAFLSLLLVLTLFLFSGCLKLDYSPPQTTSSAKYELTKTDLFAEKDWKGTDVSVFDVRLGDSMEEVIDTLGAPDLQTTFGNTTNFEYSKSLAMPKVGLLFHFSKNKLTRITMKEPFNRFLGNSTRIGTLVKEDIYRLFGAPSKLQLMSYLTTYTYEERGIEMFMDGKKLNGFSFVLPEAIQEFQTVAEKIKERRLDIEEIRKNVFHEIDS